MTGPEHYHKAEELLDGLYGLERKGAAYEVTSVAEAQVHAILALTAATSVDSRADALTWLDAAGTRLSDST